MKMDTYYDKKFDYYDGVNYLPLEVSALYTPMVICEFIALWYTDEKKRVCPWEVNQGDLPQKGSLHFDIYSFSSKKTLNYLLPELYHPVIKAEESELPYDYQIFYGGGGMMLYFNRDVMKKDIKAIGDALDGIYSKDNGSCEVRPILFDIKKANKTKVRVVFDPELSSEEEAKKIIFSLRDQTGIKKIVCR